MKDIEGLVPVIGTRGNYTLINPWETVDDLIYTCTRISSIADYKIQSSKDILKEFYLDKGLTANDYQYAIENDIKIVTLKSERQQTIDVPDNYIKLTPDIAFFPYRQYIISTNLGLLPEGLDLSVTIEEILTVISKTLNVDATPKIHTYESNRFVDWKTHKEMEDAREGGITPFNIQWQIIRDLEARNKALSDAVLELEDALGREAVKDKKNDEKRKEKRKANRKKIDKEKN